MYMYMYMYVYMYVYVYMYMYMYMLALIALPTRDMRVSIPCCRSSSAAAAAKYSATLAAICADVSGGFVAVGPDAPVSE